MDVCRETLQWLCNSITEKGWHRIDSPSNLRSYDREKQGSAIRLLWWETWSLDRLLSIVTGSRTLFLAGVPFSVQTDDGATQTVSLILVLQASPFAFRSVLTLISLSPNPRQIYGLGPSPSSFRAPSPSKLTSTSLLVWKLSIPWRRVLQCRATNRI